MSLPTAQDIRDFLEGYGLDLQGQLSLTGNLTNGSAIITNIDTTNLKPYMNLFGTGVAAAAQILTVDIMSTTGQVTMSAPATADGTAVALTVTYYTVVSDNWITQRLNNRVLPIVERMTRQSFHGVQTVTEYYDGNGGALLILRRRPIVQLLAISYTNVDSNLYYLTPSAMQVISEEGILKAKANFNESNYIPIFFRGDRNLRITYSYGYDTVPDDVGEALKCFAADVVLEHVASKTGGGNLSVQALSRDWGPEGKWSTHRKNIVKQGWALLQNYMTGMGG